MPGDLSWASNPWTWVVSFRRVTDSKPQVKHRPILFSGAMVRAIRDDRKTQTRRVLRPQPRPMCSHVEPFRGEGGGWVAGDNSGRIFGCPYGQPGDRLWVRETWGPRAGGLVYLADDGNDPPDANRWRPSIHMPRWASRLTLEVVSVRVERLQEISEEDAVAEGVQFSPFEHPHPVTGLKGWWFGGPHPIKGTPKVFPTARCAFADLWDVINGSRKVAPGRAA